MLFPSYAIFVSCVIVNFQRLSFGVVIKHTIMGNNIATARFTRNLEWLNNTTTYGVMILRACLSNHITIS